MFVSNNESCNIKLKTGLTDANATDNYTILNGNVNDVYNNYFTYDVKTNDETIDINRTTQ